MAAPVISTRPDEWNAGGGNLPLLYEITNDKFPVPSGGSTIAFTSVGSANGKAKLFGASLPGSFVADDYVYVNGSVYEGTFRVLSVDTSAIVINVAYEANDSGTVEQGYSNYKTEVDVYAGIPSGHPLNASQPIELVGTMSLVPDSNNTTYADVKAYVQKKLSTFNAAGDVNDWRLWSGFYVIVREVYDESYDNVTTSSDVDDSGNTLYASNSALQFQNANGGNMVEYVCEAGQTDRKWLTNSPAKLFADAAFFDFSAIVNTGTFSLKVQQYDINNTLVQTDTTSFSGSGVGVYRFDLSGITLLAGTVKLNAYILISGIDVTEALEIDVAAVCAESESIIIGNFMQYEDSYVMLYEDGSSMSYEL